MIGPSFTVNGRPVRIVKATRASVESFNSDVWDCACDEAGSCACTSKRAPTAKAPAVKGERTVPTVDEAKARIVELRKQGHARGDFWASIGKDRSHQQPVLPAPGPDPEREAFLRERAAEIRRGPGSVHDPAEELSRRQLEVVKARQKLARLSEEGRQRHE